MMAGELCVEGRLGGDARKVKLSEKLVLKVDWWLTLPEIVD